MYIFFLLYIIRRKVEVCLVFPSTERNAEEDQFSIKWTFILLTSHLYRKEYWKTSRRRMNKKHRRASASFMRVDPQRLLTQSWTCLEQRCDREREVGEWTGERMRPLVNPGFTLLARKRREPRRSGSQQPFQQSIYIYMCVYRYAYLFATLQLRSGFRDACKNGQRCIITHHRDGQVGHESLRAECISRSSRS